MGKKLSAKKKTEKAEIDEEKALEVIENRVCYNAVSPEVMAETYDD